MMRYISAWAALARVSAATVASQCDRSGDVEQYSPSWQQTLHVDRLGFIALRLSLVLALDGQA